MILDLLQSPVFGKSVLVINLVLAQPVFSDAFEGVEAIEIQLDRASVEHRLFWLNQKDLKE